MSELKTILRNPRVKSLLAAVVTETTGGGGSPAILVEGGAERKVSDMTAITAANVVDGDLFTLVDVSDTTDAASGTNKKMTAIEAASYFGNLVSVVGPYGRSGRYFNNFFPFSFTQSTSVMVINFLYAYPFYVGKNKTITEIATEVTAGVSGNMRMGIYSDDGTVYPGSLVAGTDVGNLSVTSPGTVTTGTISISLNPGLYWIVTNCDAAATLRAGSTSLPIPFGMDSIGANRFFTAARVSTTFGELPSSFPGSPTYVFPNVPIFYFKQ